MESKAPVSQLMDEEHYNILYLNQVSFLKKRKTERESCTFRERTFVRYTSCRTRTIHSLTFSVNCRSFTPFYSDIPKDPQAPYALM